MQMTLTRKDSCQKEKRTESWLGSASKRISHLEEASIFAQGNTLLSPKISAF